MTIDTTTLRAGSVFRYGYIASLAIVVARVLRLVRRGRALDVVS